jgi:hypothetical protein
VAGLFRLLVYTLDADGRSVQGAWSPKRISNPAYKGKWVAPDIANPEFVDDPELYAVVKDNGLVGFELWQVGAFVVLVSWFILVYFFIFSMSLW